MRTGRYREIDQEDGRVQAPGAVTGEVEADKRNPAAWRAMTIRFLRAGSSRRSILVLRAFDPARSPRDPARGPAGALPI